MNINPFSHQVSKIFKLGRYNEWQFLKGKYAGKYILELIHENSLEEVLDHLELISEHPMCLPHDKMIALTIIKELMNDR